jgi:predicted negative regulator of RcsB-dependent stress response
MYETEEQEVEALKKWWKENGRSIIGGAVIGLAIVFGWRAWSEYRSGVAAQASNAFEQMVAATEMNRLDDAKIQAERIDKEFKSTPYAAFAELMQARVRYQQGDLPGTKAALEQAIAKAPDSALRTIAALRLARVLLGAADTEGAARVLREHPASAAFAGEYALLRGDIALSQGDIPGARAAFQEAISKGVGNADLVQLKLDNLPSGS